jgi:hypothetical protein
VVQSQKNNIKTTLIQDNCLDKNISTMLDNSAFYLINGKRMELYDQNLENIGTLSFGNIINNTQY